MADTNPTRKTPQTNSNSYRTNLARPLLGCLSSVIKSGQKPEDQTLRAFLSRYPTLASNDEQTREICAQFRCFLCGSEAQRRLQLQFEPAKPPHCGSHWLYQDLNAVEQRAREAGTATLELPDNFFDRVFCIGLEEISRPITLIAEIYRIVKPGGLIWIQTSPPMLRVSAVYANRPTYWCITAVGLSVLLQNFQQLASSTQFNTDCTSLSESFYFGRKQISDEPVVTQSHPVERNTSFTDKLPGISV